MALKFCFSILSEVIARASPFGYFHHEWNMLYVIQHMAVQTDQRGLQWWVWQENYFWNELKHLSKVFWVKNCYYYSSGINIQCTHKGRKLLGIIESFCWSRPAAIFSIHTTHFVFPGLSLPHANNLHAMYYTHIYKYADAHIDQSQLKKPTSKYFYVLKK